MHSLDSSHYGYLAQEVIPGYSPTPSPPYSPFSQPEAFFTFPSTAASYNEVTRDSWRYGESQSQPPSPGYTEGGYHHPHSSGLYLTDSPLLSQSATSLNTGHEVPDPRYAMMTPVSDIPETVRFSSSSLAPEAGPVYTPEQSFGHNILYSGQSSAHSHQMYQQPSNNLQVQQWNNLDNLVLPLQDDRSKLSSISETDSCDLKSEARSGETGAEMFEEEGGEEEDEEGDIPGGIVRCKWADCIEEFPDMKGLVTHINSVHIQSKRGSEEYPCFWKNCGRANKPFNAKYKLVTHLRVHTGERPFRCKQKDCGRSFARLENLKIHNRSHTGEKPFLCKFFKECSKAFSNSSDRAKHEQTHKDPKPYKCDVLGCHKRYTDPSSLRKHIKNHSQEDQEQARLVKEASKEPVVRRGSLPDILHPHPQHQGHLQHHHWSGSQPNLESDLLMASSASTGNLHLMSGGGLVTTCHESMSRHEACHDSVTSHDLGGEQGPHWARRLETEDTRGYQPHYTYYNSSLHVEV